ncbi:MAG: prepilin-type N-terminal cleavage/methylation domain-containing protein [bacterium]
MVEKKSKGFTLIELLIVIAIIIILAAIVFVALNPLQRFQQARNAKRWADITAVLNAIKIDQIDNGGSYMAAIDPGMANGTYHEIGTCASGASCTGQAVEAGCVDLAGLVTDGYLGILPTDPQSGTAAQTGYYLMKSATGIITVGACEAEAGETIKASR